MKTLDLRPVTAAAVLALAGAAAQAQDAGPEEAPDSAWTVYEAADPRECIAVTEPTDAQFFRDGVPVDAVTDPPQLSLLFRPSQEVAGQVSYFGGFPFAGGSTIEVDLGETTYQLFAEGNWAWPATPADDTRLVEEMKQTGEVVMTSTSSRGTVVEHTFSLQGFGAAAEEAERRCAE